MIAINAALDLDFYCRAAAAASNLRSGVVPLATTNAADAAARLARSL